LAVEQVALVLLKRLRLGSSVGQLFENICSMTRDEYTMSTFVLQLLVKRPQYSDALEGAKRPASLACELTLDLVILATSGIVHPKLNALPLNTWGLDTDNGSPLSQDVKRAPGRPSILVSDAVLIGRATRGRHDDLA
jgi:hypothetical protein